MISNQNQGRAGRYVRQTSGYTAFIPAPLPPHPAIRLEGELQSWLSRADRALGRLDGSIQTLPYPDLFVAMYVRKEAVLSSQIEGKRGQIYFHSPKINLSPFRMAGVHTRKIPAQAQTHDPAE